MKSLLLIIVCLAAFNGFAQTSENIIEEKSSAWIRVPENPVTITKPKTTSRIKKKTRTSKAPAPKENAKDEFEKTNSQVNRFKKKKG
jgi:hypothetical protein